MSANKSAVGMMTQTEQAPFDSPIDAIRWADNYLLTPDCKTITGRIMDNNIQQSKGAAPLIESKSLAICITSSLAQVANPYGQAVRIVFGRGEDHRLELADHLAHATWTGPDGGKTIAAARDLALLVIEKVKRADRRGQFLSTTAIYESLDLKKSVFYERWGETYAGMRLEFERWLERGVNDVTGRLIDAGVVG